MLHALWLQLVRIAQARPTDALHLPSKNDNNFATDGVPYSRARRFRAICRCIVLGRCKYYQYMATIRENRITLPSGDSRNLGPAIIRAYTVRGGIRSCGRDYMLPVH